jgi:hypothetical protein
MKSLISLGRSEKEKEEKKRGKESVLRSNTEHTGSI